MTTEQMVREVFEALGEPSDLQYRDLNDQIDVTLPGWQRIVQALNTACLEIATWKWPRGRQLRFRFLEAQAPLSIAPLSGTVLTHTASSHFLTCTLTERPMDYYRNYALRFDTDVYRVLNSRWTGTATELILLSAPQTSLASRGLTASRREFQFVDQTTAAWGETVDGIAYTPAEGVPLEILNVYDLTGDRELEYENRFESFAPAAPTFGEATRYYKMARGFRLDVWPETARTFMVRYMRGPRILPADSLTAEPELPENFHRAVVLHALWWGYRRAQENNSAYATKKDLDELLQQLRTEYDLQSEHTTAQWSIKMS